MKLRDLYRTHRILYYAMMFATGLCAMAVCGGIAANEISVWTVLNAVLTGYGLRDVKAHENTLNEIHRINRGE